MNRRGRTRGDMRGNAIVALCVGALLVAPACGSDPETIVELRIIETIPVAFDDMAPAVPESATVSLTSLQQEPAYAEARPALRCGALSIADSNLHIEALDAPTGATLLRFEVDVGARGATLVRLAVLEGSVAEGERVALSDARVAVSPAGLQAIADVILGPVPALDVRVTGEVPGALDDLQVALSLVLDFSSVPGGCPSVATGL